jgi:hypothetical protein
VGKVDSFTIGKDTISYRDSYVVRELDTELQELGSETVRHLDSKAVGHAVVGYTVGRAKLSVLVPRIFPCYFMNII